MGTSTAKGWEQVVGYKAETGWGGAVVPDAKLLLRGAGLVSNDENTIERVLANSSYPGALSTERMSKTHSLSITHLLYPSIAPALLAMGNTRDVTTKELTSFSIAKNEGLTGVGHRWFGCKCGTQRLSWADGGMVELAHEFTAKGRAAYTWTPAGSYPTGSPYKGSQVALTVNNVPAQQVESGEVSWANNLKPGPIGSDYEIGSLNEGFVEIGVNIKAKFISDAWNALVKDFTPFTVAITFAHAGGNVTVTLTNCQAQSANQEVGEQGDMVMQTIVATPLTVVAIN